MTQLINTDPIKIIDVTEKGFNYGLWIPIIIAVISTSILIWNQTKRSKVYGKVISKIYSQSASFTYLINPNEEKTINGQQYLLKLSLSCFRKSLHYKDVNIYLTYGKKKIKGQIYWSKYNNLTFHNGDGSSSAKKYITPSENYLTFNSVLQEGETSFYYINFLVPDMEGPIIYDKLELEFTKPNNKKLAIDIYEIDPMQYFFDEDLMKN